MKRNIIVAIVTIVLSIVILFFGNQVNAADSKVISNETESQLVQLKERELSSVKDYEEAYGSKSYGFTAYVLHKVQIYSIPFCFLGIAIGAIHQYIIGIRKLDTLENVIGIRHIETKEKGLALMITFITLGVICQILPLVFTIVVKFGRE